jgi:hypothetical protein
MGEWVDGYEGVYSLTAFKKGIACPLALACLWHRAWVDGWVVLNFEF